ALRTARAPGRRPPAPPPGRWRRAPPWLTLLLAIVRRPGRVTETTRLLRTRQLQQRVEGAWMRIDVGAPIAQPGEARGHRAQREVLGTARLELLPGDRCRDARVWLRTDRIRARDRAILGVLIVVDEDAVALLLPPLAGRQTGRTALHLAREGERRATDLVERPATLEADVHVHAARARGLRPSDEVEVAQDLAHHPGDLDDLGPFDPGHRIEVDAQLVRMLEVIGPHGMRMQLETGEVRHPGERRAVARHHLVRGATRREGDGADLDPRGPARRRPLLVEELPVDA